MIVFILIFGASNVYATSDIEVKSSNLTESYKKWNELTEEEKENSIMPAMYSVDLSETETNSSKVNSLFRSIGQGVQDIKAGASATDSKYDLRNRISLEVKDQGQTLACWTFAALNSMESNLKLKYGTSPDFSERHMDYATSQSFNDGNNTNGFNRKVSNGGSTIISMAYLTNGQGAILESEMPFENNMDDISIDDINKNPSYYVKGYLEIPSIYKYVNQDGTILYSDGINKIYTNEQVNEIRNEIKEAIINYGGIIAYTSATESKYYNNPNIKNATAYFCNDGNNTQIDHAVTIIGWDDNYSKENFTGEAKPSKDGAYLILNSYSSDCFDKGYLWISYEDVWIETSLYGITESSKIDYDNIYQNNFFGANIPITLTSHGRNITEGWYSSIYDRDNNKGTELLKQISVNVNQYAKFEVYVNTKNDSLAPEDLIKVADTDVLKPGYNTIAFDPIELKGDKYAVVVKQIAVDEVYFFMIEAAIENTFYDKIEANPGYSKVSTNGLEWYDLTELGHMDYAGIDIDLSTADICIKAFTTYDDITSSEYFISNDNYITKIYDNTKISSFLDKIKTPTGNPEIYTSSGELVKDYNTIVASDMKLKINSSTYTLVVRGDLNGDGKISLIDLSRHIAHFVGIDGYVLTGAFDKASDINLDGNFSLIDVSKLLVTYTNM